MSHDHTNNPMDLPQDPVDSADWSGVSDASLVRAHADGELSDHEGAALRERLGADAIDHGTAFEMQLRLRVAATLSTVSVPPAVRERVIRALREEESADSGSILRPERGFWSSGGARLAAVAAMVALVAGVFLLGPRTEPASAPAILSEAAQHLRTAHTGCLEDPSRFIADLSGSDGSTSPEAFVAGAVGDVPVRLDLDEHGYRLAGIGGCEIPGGGKSVHLLYERIEGHGEPVSLFLQQATGPQRELREGVVYTNGRDTPPLIRIWRDGDVVYYMITSCPVGCSTVESAYALTGERVSL